MFFLLQIFRGLISLLFKKIVNEEANQIYLDLNLRRFLFYIPLTSKGLIKNIAKNGPLYCIEFHCSTWYVIVTEIYNLTKADQRKFVQKIFRNK